MAPTQLISSSNSTVSTLSPSTIGNITKPLPELSDNYRCTTRYVDGYDYSYCYYTKSRWQTTGRWALAGVLISIGVLGILWAIGYAIYKRRRNQSTTSWIMPRSEM